MPGNSALSRSQPVTAPGALYERIDDDAFAATTATQSPWDVRLQHGSPPTALLARAMLARHPHDGMRLARISAEFLGPIPLATMHVRTRVARPGRRIEMLEGAIESDGPEVVLARAAWRIAIGAERSVPRAASEPDTAPPLPPEQSAPAWLGFFGYGRALEWRYAHGEHGFGPAAVWTRPRATLIAGEPLQPLDRALLIADSANGVSRELSMDDWLFVPPSLSLALERYPEGEWTLLEARTTLSHDGLGITASRLADATGYFAVGSQALLVERRSSGPKDGA
jgi:hypothetical protein